MRIIAGDARGRKLVSPAGKDTRPTSDRVKESLFNILGSRVIDASVLDLFAGTGNLGLEALSRGSKRSVFIDSSKESIRIIHENIRLLGYQDMCEVYHNEALSALNILWRRDVKFDIIFIDPPYHKDIIPVVMRKISELDILKDDGIIVTEHDTKDVIPQRILNFDIVKHSVYGDTALSFFGREREKLEE